MALQTLVGRVLEKCKTSQGLARMDKGNRIYEISFLLRMELDLLDTDIPIQASHTAILGVEN